MTKNEISSLENMELTDDELRAMFSTKKTNSIKSITPAYALFILTECSDEEHPLTQKEIGKLLESRFELTIGRQALGRTLHTLEEAGLNVYSTGRGWYAA